MCHHHKKKNSSTKRNGLTLMELLIAVGITSMIMAALAALSSAVRSGVEYGEGYGVTTQHARVILNRISRTVQGAYSSKTFPGAIVLTKTIDGWEFPDTLVVWHPSDTPDPNRLPRYDELVIFSPDPDKPNEFMEITVPNDIRTVPESWKSWASDPSAIKSDIDTIKTATSSHRTTLTTSLRTASLITTLPDYDTITLITLGAIRFNEWRSDTCIPGTQQMWIRIEMQMVPITASGQNNNSYAIPFFGSAAYYEM